jgi:hypothetical protein
MQAANAVAASLGAAIHVDDIRIGESYALYADSSRTRNEEAFTHKDDGLVSHANLPLSLTAEMQSAFLADVVDGGWNPEFIMSKVVAAQREANGLCFSALLAGPDESLFEVHIQKIPHAAPELVANNTTKWQRSIKYRRALTRMLKPAQDASAQTTPAGRASNDAWFELQLRTMDPCKTRDALQKLVLDSPNNPARMASLISVLGNAMTEKHLATMFPVLFCSATATDPLIFGALHSHQNAMAACRSPTFDMRTEVLVTEKLGSTMESWWHDQSAAESLTWDAVLCDVMQIVCNLVAVQKHMGLVLDTCTVGSIRSKRVAPDQTMLITWMDETYRIATHGNCWKWTDFSAGSVLLGGTRLVSLGNLDMWEKMNIPFQRDLVQFACSAYKVLDGIRSHITTTAGGVTENHVMGMLNDWTICRYAYWEPDTTTRDATIQLMKLESQTCTGLQSPSCMRTVLKDVGAALTCSNSLPHLQSSHFSAMKASVAADARVGTEIKLLI